MIPALPTRLRSLAGRTARYTLVGGFCAVLNNVVIIGGDFLGVTYVMATIVAFIIVTPLAYAMHCAFTFTQRGSLGGLSRFAAGSVTAFPMFLLLMAIMVSGLGVRVAIAAPVGTLILYVWNYSLAQWTIHDRRR